MRVLVTGGAGYIGSHVAREFLDQGHDVTVFDDLSSGVRENVFAGEAFVEGDIRRPDDLRRAMRLGFDGVVHLAAFKHVGKSMTDPDEFAVNNISGTINLLNAMLEHGIRYLVFSSSASVFGEPQYLPLDEDHPTAPTSFYGFTKLEMEKLMRWYDVLKGLRYTSLRYFNASGYDVRGRDWSIERVTSNLIPVIMEVAIGRRERLCVFGTDYETKDGTCIRDYVHVSDLAVAHVLAMNHMIEHDNSNVFNLGTETGTSVLEVLQLARQITRHPIPVQAVSRRSGDPSKLYASSERIRRTLGWHPEHCDLVTILQTTWRVYQRQLPAP